MRKIAILGCRLYQSFARWGMRLSRYPDPKRIVGPHSLEKKLPTFLAQKGFKSPLLVIDPYLRGHGSDSLFLQETEKAGLEVAVFNQITSNPTIDSIERGAALYQESGCDCLIALGGGSTIDEAKAIAARIAKPNRPLWKMRGRGKVGPHVPFLVAVPTTAGTGSETTPVAAVVNPKTREKFLIEDESLFPPCIVLDDSLLASLPSNVIAWAGLSALSRAVEGYLNKGDDKRTAELALKSIQLIRDNLYAFYRDPANEIARGNMQEAACMAGLVSARARAGYAHALSNALSGAYNTPHGLADAVLLPRLLEEYGKKAEKKLAKINERLSLSPRGASIHEKAAAFIAYLDAARQKMLIPSDLRGIAKAEDIPVLAHHAGREANPLCPVPREMGEKELATFLKKLLPDGEKVGSDSMKSAQESAKITA